MKSAIAKIEIRPGYEVGTIVAELATEHGVSRSECVRRLVTLAIYNFTREHLAGMSMIVDAAAERYGPRREPFALAAKSMRTRIDELAEANGLPGLSDADIERAFRATIASLRDAAKFSEASSR